MRNKARGVLGKVLRLVESLRHRVVYFFNYHKLNRRLLKGGALVLAGMIVFVAIAALLPAHKYKDTVAIGEFSFTNSEVVSYEDDVKEYFDNGGIGTLADSGTDTRNEYEISFDDRFKNAALRYKAQECGVTLDDSDNSTSLDYDSYEFTLIREQNDNWEKKLEKCLISARNLLFVEATFDLPQIEKRTQEEANSIYADAVKRITEIEPLLRNGNSSEEIIKAVEQNNKVNKKNPEIGEDLALHAGTHWCAVNEACLNSDPTLFTNTSISRPQNIVDTNAAFEEGLQNEGDLVGLITGDNGWFAYYRLEEKTGEFNTWDDFYQSMKNQYAYDTVPTFMLGVAKTIAAPFLSVIDQDFAYANNAVRPYFKVRSQAGAEIMTTEFSTNGYANITTSYTGGSGVIYPNETSGTNPGNTGGPLNCAGTARFVSFNYSPNAPYDLVSWEFLNPNISIGSASWLPDFGRHTYAKWGGTFGAQPSWITKDFAWAGGPGEANGWGKINLGFILTVMDSEKPQPVEKSEPEASKVGNSYYVQSGGTIVDKITIREAVVSNEGSNTGKLITNTAKSLWPKTSNGNLVEANFRVRAYGPYYDTSTKPALNNNFLTLNDNKYFSLQSTQSASGWPINVDKTLIIGDEVVGQANTNNALLNLVNAAKQSGSNMAANNIVTLNNAKTADLTTWVNNDTSKVSSAEYIIVYVGANDLSSQTSLTNQYTGMVNSLKNAIRNKNTNANIVFVTPFNSKTTSSSTYTYSSANGSPNVQLGKNNPWVQMENYANALINVAASDDKISIIPWYNYDLDDSSQTDGSTSSRTMRTKEQNATNTANCRGNEECTYSVRTNVITTDSAGNYKNLTSLGRTRFGDFIIDGMRNSFPYRSAMKANGFGYGQWGFGSSILNETDGLENAGSGEQKGVVYVSGVRGDTKQATFSGSDKWPAGTYYFKVDNFQDGANGNSWQALEHWYAPFGGSSSENNEQVIKAFQPQVVSSVVKNYYNENGVSEVMTDKIYIKEQTNNANWPVEAAGSDEDGDGEAEVNVCVRAYGPFNSPQPSTVVASVFTGSNASSISGVQNLPSGNPKATVCHEMSPKNSGLNFEFTGLNESGYYYFYEYINKNGTGVEAQPADVKNLLGDSFFPSFNPVYTNNTITSGVKSNGEWAYRKFQPFATSSTLDNDCEDCVAGGDYIDTGADAVDYIKVYAASAGSSAGSALDSANNGVLSQDEKDNKYWPTRGGFFFPEEGPNYIPVKYKVHMFGPYQTPQNRKSNDTVNGSPAPSASNPWPSTGNISGLTCVDSTCVHQIKVVGGVDTGANSGNFTESGDGITPKINSLNDSKGLKVNFGPVTTPGYYYYTIETIKNDQTQKVTLDPLHTNGSSVAVSNFVISNYWKSEFNPPNEPEWTFRKFQPFITSNVHNNKPWIDVKESNGAGGSDKGEEIIDRVVARAARTIEESKNGYQVAADSNNYWPKRSDGAYVPVLFKFYICGPYQYPQEEGTTDNMTNPSNGKICNESEAKKVIAKYVTPDRCSTNPVIQNANNSWPGPTGLGLYSEGSCEINFGRSDKLGEIYQPGYYYFTSRMEKNAQTAYAIDESNPGLTTTTSVKNFILSDWQSRFNPLWSKDATTTPKTDTQNEIEWAYVQFQPVVRSYAGATQDIDSLNPNNWTTRLSYQYTNVDKAYKGLQLSCNEHMTMPTWTDMQNIEDFWDKVPPKALTCENVSDRIYIGATTTKDVDYANEKIVRDDNVDEKHWPKTNHIETSESINGRSYETIKYRTKLYGPFATASEMTTAVTGGNTLSTTPAGNNQAGKTITIVSGMVADPTYGQPVAESCLTAAKYGPNYEDFPAYDTSNPNTSLNKYYNETEKTSIDTHGYYKAVFTRDTDIDCASDGSGSLGLRDESGLPYTTLSLQPGVYVSVVEIWKSDMDENNGYNTGDTSNVNNYFNDNGDRSGDTKTINSADKRDQISDGEVRDLMANDFHSKWGDPYETLFVPPDVAVWTLRGNSDNYIVNWGARYQDQYWTAGWSDWCVTYKTIFGTCLPDHNDENSAPYNGEDDYFAPDQDPSSRAGQLRVDMYGPFEMRPDGASCSNDKHFGVWYVDAEDTGREGDSTKLENMPATSESGWFVYVFSYKGDDRVPALQTKCSDPDEQFYLGEPVPPKLETKIDIKNQNGKAPTVVSDTVKVTGDVEKDSLVKLTLFRRGGVRHNPKSDTQICSVQFKIPASNELVEYSVSDYMNADGYVATENTPEGVEIDANRCFADSEGHYYWYEEFFDPDGEPLMPPRDDGPNEFADIEKEKPTVTTIADPRTLVGEPFHDVAQVRIPESDTKTYHLYMRAYGPTSGAPVCDTVGKTNLLFESGPHEVSKTGSYPSGYTTSLTTGYVYWIESLVDPETDETVAEGWCGKELEMTHIVDTPPPGEPWTWTPGAPSAGEIALSAAKIVGLASLLALGAWQLSARNSWLMRKLNH